MSLLGQLVYWALTLFFYALLARFVADLVMSFSRGWRPKGILVPLLEIVYSITDPPLRFVRKFIPPLRLGGISLDFGFTLVLIATLILRDILVSVL